MNFIESWRADVTGAVVADVLTMMLLSCLRTICFFVIGRHVAFERLLNIYKRLSVSFARILN